ncbi:MAG: retroviral-like aspartic protease family protein [Pacificimonas sp.]
MLNILPRAAALLFASAIALGAAPVPPATQSETLATSEDRDRRITVPVTLAGRGPYPFLIDTGAERSIMGTDLATELGLTRGPPVVLQSLSKRATVQTVKVDDLKMSRDVAHDLTMPLLSTSRLGAAGIIGLDSLQGAKVLFDISGQTITVSPAKRRSKPKRADKDDNVIIVTARRRQGRLVVQTARIGSRRVNVIIDTGAEMSIGNSALRTMLLGGQGERASNMTVITDVTGQAITAEVARLPDLRIGRLVVQDSHVALTNARVFRELGLEKQPALLLGMNAIRMLDRMEIDFPNRRVTFVTDDHARRDARKYIAAK